MNGTNGVIRIFGGTLSSRHPSTKIEGTATWPNQGSQATKQKFIPTPSCILATCIKVPN